LVGLVAGDGEAAGKGFEEGTSAGDCGVCAGGYDPEAAGCGVGWGAEDGGADKVDSAGCVLSGEALGEHDADGAAEDVKQAGGKSVDEAVDAEEDFVVSGVVGEHGDDCVRAEFGFSGGGGGDGAFMEERLGALFGAVPDGELVAGGEEAEGHGCAHCAEA